jgi:hypothetical protein
MSINKIQFQEGYSILELFDNYGTDEQCRKALFDWKFKMVLSALNVVPRYFIN